MKLSKRIKALLLCTVLLCSVVAFTACGDEDSVQTDAGENLENGDPVAYKVTVVDGLGNPYTEKIIVKFMQNGSQVAMATIDKSGVVSKELPAGEYSVEIATTESGVDCYYDAQKAKVTADAPQLQLTMAHKASGEQITFDANSAATGTTKEYSAYTVCVGSTYVTLDQEDRTYVVFAPTEAGIYQFSVTDDAAYVGYYGVPHFVQEGPLTEVTENTFELPVEESGISTDSSGTTKLVIGLDVEEGAEGAILNIQRTGDVAWSITSEPWSMYQPKSEIKPYSAPESASFKSFDITAPSVAYKLHLNENDGYYHLNNVDGPVVYAQLANECYGISMKTMVGEIIYVDGVLMQSGVTSFRYMYDNGPEDFFKEDYTDLMRQCVTNRDPRTGVYPLTQDLYYALTMGIEFQGWCDPNNANYRFNEVAGVNNEISWLFLCVYEDTGEQAVVTPDNQETEQAPTGPSGNTGSVSGGSSSGDNASSGSSSSSGSNSSSGSSGSAGNTGSTNNTKPIEDNKNEPIEIGGTLEFEAQVKANHIVYYNLYRLSDTTLKINSDDAYVIYNRKTYYAKNGVVSVPNLYSSSANVPVKIAIGNQGTSDATFAVTMSYPAGHKMNPYKLSVGSVTTKSDAGNSQGVYYTFTAAKNGTLTVTLDQVSGGNQGNLCITSSKVNGGTVAVDLRDNPGADGKSVSLELSSGETVEVQIAVLPDDGFNYPEATIQSTVTFQ